MTQFDFSKEYVLENDVVCLRPMEMKHLEMLLAISNDDNIWKYLFANGKEKAQLETYMQTAIHNRKLEKEYPFIIFDKIKNQVAGTTRLYELNQKWKTLKMGHTWLGEKFRGTGVNKQCKYLLLEFVFEKLKMERVGFGVHAENVTSIKALESLGCQQEGALRSFLPKVDEEGRADLLLFSMLRNEWINECKSALELKMKNNNH